eukprot:2116989-Pyramimonas_sp.AAC.1
MTQKLGQKQQALENHKIVLEQLANEALEAEQEFKRKQGKVQLREATIKQRLNEIAKIEADQKQWLLKARGEGGPKAPQ